MDISLGCCTALGRGASAAVCTTLPGFVMVAEIFSLGACPLTSIFSWAGSAESKLQACRRLTVCQCELSGFSLASALTWLAVFVVGNIYFQLWPTSSSDGSPIARALVLPVAVVGFSLSPCGEGGLEGAMSLYRRCSRSEDGTGTCDKTLAGVCVQRL